MLVDPEILRAFAAQVHTASTTVARADVGQRVSTAADGLSGSTTQWAAGVIGAHIREMAIEIAANVDRMGVAVRGAGDKYEVTDGDLAAGFEGIF